ncbi:MAG: hypothetical protein ACR2NU_10215 [Aeoliella sp.]
MPCYLFTYHPYGSWLPDRNQGYVRRGQGIQKPDASMMCLYQDSMKGNPITLASGHQRAIIRSVIESQQKQRFEAYFVATEPTHAHILLSWKDDRRVVKMRGLVKGSLTRALNKEFIRREWFAEGGSRKRVRDRTHFEYLVEDYLPKHSGRKWSKWQEYFK